MGNLIDRRGHARGEMALARRRYPRVRVPADVYYESDWRALWCERADLSLRGLFIPCRYADAPGREALVRIDAGPGALVKARVEIVHGVEVGRPGMALRFVALEGDALQRLGRLLVHHGGYGAFPQLAPRFATAVKLPLYLVRKVA